MPIHSTTKIITEEYGTVPIHELAGQTFHISSRISFFKMFNDIRRIQEAKVTSKPEPTACHKITLQTPGGFPFDIVASDKQVWVMREDFLQYPLRYTTNELKLGGLVSLNNLTNPEQEAIIIGIEWMYWVHPCYKILTEKYDNYTLDNGTIMICDYIWMRA